LKSPLLLLAVLILCHSCKMSNSNTYTIGDRVTIKSKILDEDREIFIHVPEGFYGMDEHDLAFPVLYVIDGESLFIPTVGIVNQMTSSFTANDKCPAMIIVGIPNNNRWKDLSPTSAVIGQDSSFLDITGGAPQFAQFIKEELIPYVDNNYPTESHRTLIGHSLGGLFAMYSLIEHSDLFSNYICIDPEFTWDDNRYIDYITKKLGSTDFKNKAMYFPYANTHNTSKSRSEILKDTSELLNFQRSLFAFEDALDSSIALNGVSIETKYHDNESHYSIPLIGITDGLKHLYADHHFTEMPNYYNSDTSKEQMNLVSELKDHFGVLSKKHGYTLKPKESYINAWAFGFVDLGKPEIGRELLDYNIQNYPSSPNTRNTKGEYYLIQGDTVKALEMFKKSMAIKSTDGARNRIRELE